MNFIGLWSSTINVRVSSHGQLRFTSTILEPCPFQIQTSLGESKKVYGMTSQTIFVKLQLDHPTNVPLWKVRPL